MAHGNTKPGNWLKRYGWELDHTEPHGYATTHYWKSPDGELYTQTYALMEQRSRNKAARTADSLVSEHNEIEIPCRWCAEGKPEWSHDAKVWIHRRDRLDRRCENPPASPECSPAVIKAMERFVKRIEELKAEGKFPPTPESDSTASTTHENPKSDKLTSCPTDLD